MRYAVSAATYSSRAACRVSQLGHESLRIQAGSAVVGEPLSQVLHGFVQRTGRSELVVGL